MYKDIISYRLAEGVSEEHLLDVADEVLSGWMSKQAGFVKWEIHRNSEGGLFRHRLLGVRGRSESSAGRHG